MKLLLFGRTLILALVLSLLTSPIVPAEQNTECNVRITLLQVNDVYQFMPVDLGTRGGIGRVLTLRKTIQSQNPNTLFLLAGDTISPSGSTMPPLEITNSTLGPMCSGNE